MQFTHIAFASTAKNIRGYGASPARLRPGQPALLLGGTLDSRHACIEEVFGWFDRVNLPGGEVALQGFDLENELTVVAPCSDGKRRARVALESFEFPNITTIEARWFRAWKQFSGRL